MLLHLYADDDPFATAVVLHRSLDLGYDNVHGTRLLHVSHLPDDISTKEKIRYRQK